MTRFRRLTLLGMGLFLSLATSIEADSSEFAPVNRKKCQLHFMSLAARSFPFYEGPFKAQAVSALSAAYLETAPETLESIAHSMTQLSIEVQEVFAQQVETICFQNGCVPKDISSERWKRLAKTFIQVTQNFQRLASGTDGPVIENHPLNDDEIEFLARNSKDLYRQVVEKLVILDSEQMINPKTVINVAKLSLQLQHENRRKLINLGIAGLGFSVFTVGLGLGPHLAFDVNLKESFTAAAAIVSAVVVSPFFSFYVNEIAPVVSRLGFRLNPFKKKGKIDDEGLAISSAVFGDLYRWVKAWLKPNDDEVRIDAFHRFVGTQQKAEKIDRIYGDIFDLLEDKSTLNREKRISAKYVEIRNTYRLWLVETARFFFDYSAFDRHSYFKKIYVLQFKGHVDVANERFKDNESLLTEFVEYQEEARENVIKLIEKNDQEELLTIKDFWRDFVKEFFFPTEGTTSS